MEEWKVKEKIAVLEAQVKALQQMVKFQKLDRAPQKYKKAFPVDGEYPYFDADVGEKFKDIQIYRESARSCEPLESHHFTNDGTLTEEAKIEFDKAKNRMKYYGEKAKHELDKYK